MLNKKKVLALVLAAATAFTFAPVSTLGLAPVVEAEAAATSISATAAGSLGTDDWDGTTNNAEYTSTVSNIETTGYVTLSLTGASTVGTDYNYNVSVDGSSAAISELSEVQTGKNKIAGAGTATTKKLVFKATKTGVTKVTITNDLGTAATADDTKATLTITVNGAVSTAPTFKLGTESVSSVNMHVGDSAASVAVEFPGEIAGNTFYYKSSDATVSNLTAASGTLIAGTKASDPVTATVSVPATTAGEAKLLIYKTLADADADTDGTKAFATLPIKVSNYSFGVTASNLVSGTAGKFAYTTVANSPITIAIKKGDTDVTSQFTFFLDNGSGTAAAGTYLTNPIASPTANSTGYFWVRPDSAAAGTYTVEVSQGTGTSKVTKTADFTVSASGTSSDAEVTSNTDSDVFGGVTTALIATDNTTYSLVNSNAQFKLNGTWYTADQLKWYLTKTPSTTPTNMGFTQGSAVITESGAGKLDVKVNNASQFKSDVNGASIVGVYTSGAVNKVVCQKTLTVTDVAAGVVTRTYDAGTITKNLTDVNTDPVSKDFLDGITFIGTNNKFLNGSNSTIDTTNARVTGAHFSAALEDATGAGDGALKASTLSRNAGTTISRNGVYYEKFYVPYTDTTENTKFVAEITVKVSVNAGPKVEVKEGNFVYSLTDAQKDNQSLRDEKVIDLDLAANKTFDLAKHIYSNKDNTTYSYSIDTQNVTEKDGVITAAKVGTATVKITPKANGVEGAPVYVFFRVNQNANDQISVAGKDGDKATVLTTRQYAGNNYYLTAAERNLAAAQVGYVQIEVTGNETADVKEALTVKGTGTPTYALAGDAKHGESVDAKTGEITIPHSYLNSTNFKSYVFPVKVVSSETTTSALTTGYFYVVVDYPDAQITGVEDSYEVGTSLTSTSTDSWLNLGLDKDYGPKHVSSNATITKSVLDKYDDLDDSKIYTDDDQNAFNWDGLAVTRATAADKTEHVLLSASDATNKIGNTYKVVTLKSVAGKSNYVTKIENVATGKTLYESSSAVSGAAITIDKATKVKVTVAYAPDKSLNPKDDPAFTIWKGGDGFNFNTVNVFVAATENPKTYEITLIPSQEGTQIIAIAPTEGRLSKSDYSLVGEEDFNLSVKYDASAATTKPAKVTGVKVSNKKGSKVTVSFKKVTTAPTIRYYVQKKIGKKTSGKSIGSTKTTLSVKKGATVKVRVKAYYYDENGSKHVGAYSAWKTLKTDKK